MSFNPLAILHERQCAHIYDSIDAGRSANAVKECDVLLAKEPHLHLASALKSIALCRLNRRGEANTIIDKLIKLDGSLLHSSILNVLEMACNSLERQADEAAVYDVASKAHPNNVEIGAKACLSMARANQWQKLQQTALRTHKAAVSNTKKGKDVDDLYFWWSMQAYCLAADDAKVQGHQLALPLAQRMIAKHIETQPFGERSDECMFLYCRILQKSGKAGFPKALEALSSSPLGKSLCHRSMTLAALRRDIQKQSEEWNTVYSESVDALTSDARNWTDVEDAVESAFQISIASDGSKKALKDLQSTLCKLAETKKKDRSARLSVILLSRVARERKQRHDAIDFPNFLKLISEYFDDFCGKACTFEDLESAVRLCDEQERQTLWQKMSKISEGKDETPFADDASLNKVMNAIKLARIVRDPSKVGANDELQHAIRYLRFHVRSLALVKDLPPTEMQPSDDFALLCVQALLHAQHLAPKDDSNVRLAFAVLRSSLQRSPKAYRLRILYIRLLLQFGATDAARLQFITLGVKGVQFETLGWTIADDAAHRALLLSPGSDEEREYLSLLRQMRSVWRDGQVQVPAMACKALEHGTFSRVEEMLTFGDRLTSSFARHSHIVENLRLESMSIGTGVDVERLLKEFTETQQAIDQDTLHDQRDRRVMPDYICSGETDIGSITSSSWTTAMSDKSRLSANALILSHAFGIKLSDSFIDSLPPTNENDRIYNLAKVLQDGGSIGDQEVQSAFAALADGLDNSIADPSKRPCDALNLTCTAIELAYFIRRTEVSASVRQSMSDGLEKTRRRLEEWLAELKASAAAPSGSLVIAEEWCTLLNKLGNDNKDVAALLNEEGEKLPTYTAAAIVSLVTRINTLTTNE